ncbi:poly(A)-specific ribonuclease PARN-like [Tropilaelaps mercedesae]|uniref:Poly(A)-specific ribonuclease PARN-like n=1 Tax=Tropilaelaps mercedesae TaxID=418985 RepID=A0A1V9X8M7_9ACAR|nr:poly(A)-specific ribonuclease PARN-like [Tropilaelaps mercedesae]
MDVTKNELASKRAELEAGIQSCCFVAIDCEFTGLVLPRALHPLDTTAERYSKLREGVSNYLVLQLGLSLWTYDDGARSYVVKTYNFYTFPDGQQTFLSETGCMKFLIEHGFDLNRCVRDGLPFMRPAEFEKRQECLRLQQISELEAFLPERYKSEILDVLEGRVSADQIQKAAQPSNIVHTREAAAEEYIMAHWNVISRWIKCNKNELILPACNELVRVAFYRHMERIFFNAPFKMEAVQPDQKEQAQPGVKKIRLLRSETTPLERLLERHKTERTKLDEHLGLSSILKTLSLSRKPVILHNCIRDLLHIVSQFFVTLPEEYVHFQALCKEIFPTLFDTKFMVSFGVLKQYFRGSRLIDLYTQIKNQKKTFPMPSVIVPEGYGYIDATREHEAGYDAWITGYIFAALSQFILPNKDCFCKLDASEASIVPFKNKIPFPSSLDITCLDLDLQRESLQRSNVFVVEWSESESSDYARALVTRVGGFKKIGYGDRVLAFIPNNRELCIRALKSTEQIVPQCRFYRYSGKTVQSPANSSKNRASRQVLAGSEESPPKFEQSPMINFAVGMRGTDGRFGNADSCRWTGDDQSDSSRKKPRVEDDDTARDVSCRPGEAFPEADW